MLTFKQQLNQVSNFLKPENLAAQILKYEGEVALLVVDIQGKCCAPKLGLGNDETVAVAKRIGLLAPEFRKAAVPVYVAYISLPGIRGTDFYEFEPCMGDVLIGKSDTSAFASSNIGDVLRRNRMKLLLVCGFNLNACVKQTVLDARKAGFEVCLLRDLAGNGILSGGEDNTRQTLEEMQQAGVMVVQSDEVLKQLQANARKNTQILVCRR